MVSASINMTSKESTNHEKVVSDDATWILTSAFIIFTMQSGFGLLESGLVSRKNEVNIMVKNAVDVIFGGLAYWAFGFAFSFGEENGSNGFSGFNMFFTDADETKMGQVFAKYFFQLSFATTATTIVSGALAERTNLKAYIAFSFFNTLTYCFPAHWIWSKNGWLRKLGAIDIAGSSAVHVVGGTSGLVATLYLGPRYGRFSKRRSGRSFNRMACPTNVILGTFMLWWGWLGFNCGSTFGISDGKWKLAARSAVCTINSSIGGGISGIFYSYICYKNKLRVEELVTGILGGLVGITGVCTVTKPWEALVIGTVGGIIACLGCYLLRRLKIDDPVGCVPVHLLSGAWSLVAVAAFVEEDLVKYVDINREALVESRWKLLGVQIALVVCCSAWAASVTLLLFFVINKFTAVRMSVQEEMQGADLLEHGIKGDFVSSAFGSRRRASIPSSDECFNEPSDEPKPAKCVISLSNGHSEIHGKRFYNAILDINQLKLDSSQNSAGHVVICLENVSSTQHPTETIEDNFELKHTEKEQLKKILCKVCIENVLGTDAGCTKKSMFSRKNFGYTI